MINKLEVEIKKSGFDIDVIEDFVNQLNAKESELILLDNEMENLVEIDKIDEEINTRELYRKDIIKWKLCGSKILKQGSNMSKESNILVSNSRNKHESDRDIQHKIKFTYYSVTYIFGKLRRLE